MIRDERLRETTRRAQAKGFLLLFALLLIDLNYRLFYLGESPREHWDLAAIWFAGVVFVFGSLLVTGGYSGGGGKLKRFFLMMFVVNMVVHTARHRDFSPGHLAVTALQNVLVLAAFAAVIFAFTRLWEWRKGLTDSGSTD